MKLVVAKVLFFLGFAQICRGQTNGTANPVNSNEAAAALSTNSYAVLGATPQQEALVRSQIQTMQPDVLPLRIVFVPHWKYVDNTRIFRLHVPAGYTSSMFTHLPSRTVFIDADRYISDESLGYWLAHELGHLATNSSNEEDAERAAHKFRINKHHYRLLAKGVSVCALLCCASLTLTAQQTQEVKTKQVGRLENLFVIEVGVGGKPRHFIVDTGASMTMVSKEVGQSTLVVQKYSVVNSTGHDSSVDVARIELTIGSTKTLTNAFVSDMGAVSRASGMKIDGIVGQDLLSQFKTVTFNYRTKTITFVSE